MMDTVWKRISAKRPKGAKLTKIVGIVSAMVWITAGSAYLMFKDKPLPALTEGLGQGGGKAASGHGEGAKDLHGDVGDHGISLANVSHEPAASESHDAEHHSQSATAPVESEQVPSGTEASIAPAETHEGNPADEDAPQYLPSREETAALRQLVDLLYADGTLDKAVAPLRRVMMVPTREIPLLTMATDIFLGTGNYKEALEMAEQVLALKPDDMHIKAQAVESQFRLGEVEKAFAAGHSALERHPGNLEMLVVLGTMEVEMGPGYKDYGKSLLAARKLAPNSASVLYLGGRKAQLEGDFKDAETAFRHLVKLEPRNHKALGQLGMALFHLGKEKEAENAFRAELDMNPKDYNTWFNLGEIHLARAAKAPRSETVQALRADAMECYLKALEYNLDHAEAHFRVGVLLNGNGQYKEAIRHLEAALRSDSRHVPTLLQLSVAFENLKQMERARSYMNRAYELDPLNKVVLFKLKQWS